MPPRPSLRRAFRIPVAALAVAIAVVAAFLLATNPLDINDKIASVAGVLVTLGLAFVPLWRWLSAADSRIEPRAEADALTTELLEQWAPEITHRREQFGDARTIPLTWQQAYLDRSPVRLPDNGRLADNPDEAARSLATRFNQIPGKRRLVLLGEPGAGKTFLGITLTVGLLRQRKDDDGDRPVPVFLSLSTWDPTTTGLDAWIIRSLAADHYGGNERIPRTLVNHQLVLPILDSLDELPEQFRRRAISRINDTLRGNRPIVLTCRSAEYADGLAGGAPELLHAPVIEVQPLSTNDIVTHLQQSEEQGEGWADVVAEVERAPAGPLGSALSTPLMLSLFCAAYKSRDPRELITQDYTSRHAVEDRLVDLLVETVYPPDLPNMPWWWRPRPWTASPARKWLTLLARYLHDHGERDIAWWKMESRTVSQWAALVVGLAAGLLAYAVASIIKQQTFNSRYLDSNNPIEGLLNQPLVFGIAVAVVIAFLWFIGARTARRRMDAGGDGAARRFRRGMVTGFSLTIMTNVPLIFVSTPVGRYAAEEIEAQSALIGAVITLALIVGVAVGVHEYRGTFATRPGPAEPRQFLRQDRRSTLVDAASTGLLVIFLCSITMALARTFGGHIGQRFALWLGWPTTVDTQMMWRASPDLTADSATVLLTAKVLLFVLFALAVLTTRPWPRFLVARLAMGLTGKLPLRLMRFLADARDKGLMRGAGGTYQFWHVRLQERLVSTSTEPRPARRSPVVRRTVAAIAGVVLVFAAISIADQVPDGECRPTGLPDLDAQMARAVAGSASACFAFYSKEDLLRISARTSAGVAFPQPSSMQSGGRVTVVGDLTQLDAERLRQLADGLNAAAAVTFPVPNFHYVHSEASGHTSETAAVLSYLFTRSLSTTYLSLAADQVILVPSSTIPSNEEPTAMAAMIIGTRATDENRFVEEYRRKWEEKLFADTDKIAGLSARALTDGLDEAECAILRGHRGSISSSVAFDLRDVQPDRSLLVRFAQCTTDPTLVMNDSWRTLLANEKPLDLPDFTYAVIKQDPRAAPKACRDELGGEKADQAAVMTCIAALGAAADMRITTPSVFE